MNEVKNPLIEWFWCRLAPDEAPAVLKLRTWKSAMTHRRFFAVDIRRKRVGVKLGRGR